MSKYKCITHYIHNPYCIVPKGAIIEVYPDENRFMILAVYKGRNMKLNYTTLRKYFKEVK